MYAPIVIPTCNRIIHLKRCINSLLKSPLAVETEIYISVDYPPEKKYEEGYTDVIDYVKNLSGFKQVHYYIQERNLGPIKNYDFLLERLKENGYERLIFTEDDNEFSEAFLEYVNKGLDRYKDDSHVMGICVGMRSKATWGKNKLANYYLCRMRYPYGYGIWLEKNDKLVEHISQQYFDEILKNPELLRKLFKRNKSAFCWFATDLYRECPTMRSEKDELQEVDVTEMIVSACKDWWYVYPSVPLARNWGFDGTGVNASASTENPADFMLPTDKSFDFEGRDDYWKEYDLLSSRICNEFITGKRLIRSIIIVLTKKYCSDRAFLFIKKIIQRKMGLV